MKLSHFLTCSLVARERVSYGEVFVVDLDSQWYQADRVVNVNPFLSVESLVIITRQLTHL